jgi:hypothetical protein
VPGLVGVEHEPRRGGVDGEDVPQDAQAAQVVIQVAAALELGGAVPAVGEGAVDLGELFVRERDLQGRRVAGHVPVPRPEEAPERLVGGLGLEVPEREVDSADRPEDRTGVPELEDPGEHPVVQRHDTARVLAVDAREDAVDLGVRPDTDALEPDVRGEDEHVGLGGRAGDVAVDVPDRAPPVVLGDEGAVPGDPHAEPSEKEERVIPSSHRP